MRVERVEHEHGSYVVPAFDPSWDDLTHLRWEAAVVSLDTGLDVTVELGESWYRKADAPWQRIPDAYDVRCNGAVHMSTGLRETLALLHGLSFGARAMRRYHRIATTG